MYMKIKDLKEIIENYLQTNCSDFWTVICENNKINVAFSGSLRFVVELDEDNDILISGNDLDLEILVGLGKVLGL